MILVVEDDQCIRKILEETLEMAGYQVLTAANGRDALDKLRTLPSPPELILLDWMMPVLSGDAFMKIHQADQAISPIPVIIISAGNSAFESHGATGVLRKPFTIDQLYSIVGPHCKK